MRNDPDTADRPLDGRSVLVVEDEFLLADDMRDLVERLGGKVIGPVSSPRAALDLLGAEQPDLALLDINLSGERVYPVAEALRRKGVPMAFTTGYGKGMIDPRFRDEPHLEKPVTPSTLRALLARLKAAG